MVTVQQVFDMAIHIIDEQNESTGATMTVDTEEYKSRTVSILNSVLPRLYPYSGNYKSSAYGIPMPNILKWDNYRDPDFTQAIDLDDTLCLSLLPFYLAAHLVIGENTELANWCLNMYNTHFVDLRDKIPAEFEPIPMPYGAF
jgi:hypothetical protein